MNNKRILIIGQAPPYQKQSLPYDTTMLYEWFEECGISKEQAQEMFEFDAVYNKFPGYADGSHAKPTTKQMDEYWPTLELKIQCVDKVIVLGNVAKDYINTKEKTWGCSTEWLYLMHPSRMNHNRYVTNKSKVIEPLKKFLQN